MTMGDILEHLQGMYNTLEILKKIGIADDRIRSYERRIQNFKKSVGLKD